eukprot:456808_1
MGNFIINESFSNNQPITIDTSATNIILENVQFYIMPGQMSYLLLPPPNNLLMVNIAIHSFNKTKLLYYHSICDVLCNQMMNYTIITQIKMVCDTQWITWDQPGLYRNDKWTGNLLDWNGTEQVTHSSAHRLAFIPLRGDYYYPGEFLLFEYMVMDKFGNKIDDYNHAVTLTAYIENKGYSEQIIIDEEGHCQICDDGIYVPSITLKEVGNVIQYHLKDTENVLLISDVNIVVVKCPTGYGSDTGSHCTKCPENFYKLTPDTITPCKHCQTDVKGIECKGSDKVVVSQHYWIAVQNVTNVSMNIRNVFADDATIISSGCPYNQCCQLKDGCNYLTNISSLCAPNRNYSVALCAVCLFGFSESPTSTSCVKCDAGISYEWLLCIFALSTIVSMYLVLSKLTDVNKNKKPKIVGNIHQSSFNTEAIWLLNLIKNERFMLMILLMFSKVIIYYEQSISQILSSGNIVVNLSTLSSFFDLSINVLSVSNGNNEWCFINGLTNKYKLLSNFMPTIMITVLVVCVSLIINKIYTGEKKVLVWKVFISLLLLCIGQVLSIIFKLLSCQRIGSENSGYFVHFYFGNERCYGTTWFLALFGLLFVISIFILLFIKIKRMDYSQRQDKQSPLHVLIRAFKPNCWYWEFVILGRRILVVFMATSFNSKLSLFLLIFILGIFLFLQQKYQPFIIQEVNTLEFVLIFALVLVVSVQFGLTLQSDYQFAYVILSILTILPFILFIFHTSLSLYKMRTVKSEHTNKLFLLKQRIKFLILYIIVYYSPSSITRNNVYNQQMPIQQIEMQAMELPQTTNETKYPKYNANNDNCE